MTFETTLYSLIIPFFPQIFFFLFFNSIAKKLRDWIWFPSRLSAEKLLSWSFRSSSAGEKTHCRKREREKKKSPPMCRYTSAVTVKRHYAMSERKTILQFRESEQCGFHFSNYLSSISITGGGKGGRTYENALKKVSIF